jgi:CcmD family protein
MCVLVLAFSTGAWAQAPQTPAPQTAAPQKPTPAQEEFVPLSEIPPEEQIPAFTLVASAYAFVWIVLIGYVWSVARRLQKVETDLATLSRERP